jgi:hypothetical protein
MKGEIETEFKTRYPELSITFSADIGQIILVRLEPLSGLDILGETVNRTFLLGRRAMDGDFVISSEVYRRLAGSTQRRFRPVEIETIYAAS